ncbi:hypothetical membrane protein (DUF4149 domain) [Campylobacter iguaniorum]|uniref:Hypothetical membrane protein (DUF4149 domain) n=1 Tax=Campylobacter iguaniorum TaxID=1244531 RepID=A0A076FA05_9BACT|nr:DUF4149 domain-containing protein [Campylobacter iguaniorum]AII14543.1 hypothetical membrane protein (DUF4149 domain) [Campylobacter iguaniorum]
MRKIYIFLLAMIVGMEISIGAFLAPVVFFPASIIGEGVLTHFQSGQLMTQVFLKFNNVLLVVSVVAIVYEGLNLRNKDESFAKKISSFMLALIALILALAFIFYFSAYVVEAQKLGAQATSSVEFAKMHKASELVMKIMMIAQAMLFYIKAKA